jgi:hypothetical protein
MGLAIILLFVVLVVAGAAVSYYLKQKRRKELALVAGQFGLQFWPTDTQGCLGLPFHLFTKGDGRGVANVMWGTWQGIPLQEFDYWYYEESSDSNGNRSKTYYRFSCAVTEIEPVCPSLRVERENLLTSIADHIGLHDIEFESEEFNREFNVKGEDRKFASDFIDARMMEWLLATEHGFGFEVAGRWLLCYGKRRAPLELVPLIGTVKQFREHVPRVVFELYGGPGTD